MEIALFEVQAREELGKGPARRMRADGLVPGVAYGLGRETTHLAVPADELSDLLRHTEGGNVVLDLKVPGTRRRKDIAAIIKAIQRDPVTRAPLSIDFQWISLEELITVDVPVHVTGVAPGVEEDGGVVEVVHHTVPVSCLPTDIPDSVTVTIDGLKIGDTVYARDLQIPEGSELELDLEEAVVSIAAPISEEDLEVRVDEGLLEELVDLEAEEVPAEELEEVAEEEAAEEGAAAEEAPAEEAEEAPAEEA